MCLLAISDLTRLAWPTSQRSWRGTEIKHARLAMLAAAGWPLSEKLNLNPDLLVNGRAPSLLNGGLGNINTLYWVAALGLVPQETAWALSGGTHALCCFGGVYG